MDWKPLFDMQDKLDTYIVEQHELQDRNLFEEKILALFVELGELANETRCFKFWSNKPANEKSVILEEYVDNVHFIMSLGLMKGLTFDGTEASDSETDLTRQFNKVFASALVFKDNPEQSQYEKLFAEFLLLGQLLGFTEEEVQSAYYEKNRVNFERQDEGY